MATKPKKRRRLAPVERDADGIPYADCERGKLDPNALIIRKCPLCGERHMHGGGTHGGDGPLQLGLRQSHCWTPLKKRLRSGTSYRLRLVPTGQ